MKSAILLEDGDLQLLAVSRSVLAFVVGNCFWRGGSGRACPEVLPGPRGRFSLIHGTANLGRSGQQRYIFGGAIKRFLVQKPQLVALRIFGGPNQCGVAEVFAAPKSQIGLAKNPHPL
jgi:hypothetical protein